MPETPNAPVQPSPAGTRPEKGRRPWFDREVVNVLLKRRLYRKLLNYLIVNYQYQKRTNWVTGYPYYVYIDPSSRCTLGCPFCAVGSKNYPKPMMDLDFNKFRSLMREIGPTMLVAELYVKGEPLMNKRIYEMIELCKKYRTVTVISSNMQDVDEAAADRIVGSGLDYLKASIDGVSQESYEKYRINGDAGEAFAGLRRVVEARRRRGAQNPFIEWKFIVFRHNEHEIERAKELAREIGVDSLQFCAATVGPPPLSPEQEAWLPMSAEHRMYDLGGSGVTRSFDLETEVAAPCNLPWKSVTFDPRLNVSTCCRPVQPENDHGRYRWSFLSLWNNRRFRESRRAVRNDYKDDSVERSNMCNGCPAKGSHSVELPMDLVRRFL